MRREKINPWLEQYNAFSKRRYVFIGHVWTVELSTRFIVTTKYVLIELKNKSVDNDFDANCFRICIQSTYKSLFLICPMNASEASNVCWNSIYFTSSWLFRQKPVFLDWNHKWKLRYKRWCNRWEKHWNRQLHLKSSIKC